jgi:hypothetical protein
MFQDVVDLRQALPRVPDIHVGVDVGKAELTQQERLAVFELCFHPVDIGAELVAHLRDHRRHRRDVEFRAAQL